MSFFAQSSGFCINDSHISEIGRDYNININFATGEPAEPFVTNLLGKRKVCHSDGSEPDAGGLKKRQRVSEKSSDGLMVVQPTDIDLHRELASGPNYRIHSASYGGRVVAVKVFDGPCAKQNWAMNVALAKSFLHPNVPKIVGVFGSLSESPFIVLHGISGNKMKSLLVKALRTDLNKSVELSMKTVKGLAAGLGYMESQNTLSKGVLSTLKWEDFDIFASCSNEPLISINLPSDTTTCGPRSASSFYTVGNHGCGIEVLNGLCQKLFSEVNSFLYDDSPERESDTYDPENLSRVVQINSEDLSSTPEDNSIATKRYTVNKSSRREVWWKPDKILANRSLDSIARRFEDYLDCVSSSTADSALRRVKALLSKRTSHRCPGYLREEITLTADVTRSAVVAHQYPSQSEICSICGQLVQYPIKQGLHDTKCQSPPPEEAPSPAGMAPDVIHGAPPLAAGYPGDVSQGLSGYFPWPGFVPQGFSAYPPWPGFERSLPSPWPAPRSPSGGSLPRTPWNQPNSLPDAESLEGIPPYPAFRSPAPPVTPWSQHNSLSAAG